jgi:hypothetical protein
MIPIYEQGAGRGIGHNFDSFRNRFDAICQAHLAEARARAFAFIFYDFTDQDLRRILKDQGAFAQLDRLSGTELSIFYLHSGTRWTVEAFNTHFLATLGVSETASLPCVVFFRVNVDVIEDIAIAQLDNADLIHGFHELYGAIERYIQAGEPTIAGQPRAMRWLKSSGKFIGLEIFRAALKRGLDFF